MEKSLYLALPDWRAWHRFSILTDAPAVPSPVVTLHVDVTAIWMANWHKNGDARRVASLQGLISLFQAALCNKNQFFPIAPETWIFWCFFSYFLRRPLCIGRLWESKAGLCLLRLSSCRPSVGVRTLTYRWRCRFRTLGSPLRMCCSPSDKSGFWRWTGTWAAKQPNGIGSQPEKPNKIWNFALPKCAV